MKTIRNAQKENGFSMIEVLIAFLIIMVGVLGFAKSQALALSSTNVSNIRSNVALQAASLASAMHANTAYWGTGLAPANFTVTGNAISNGALNANNTVCTTQLCTPIQLAAFDLKEWGNNLQRQFTNGRGSLVCSTASTAPITCTISISWEEKTVALNSANAASGQLSTQNYMLIVEP